MKTAPEIIFELFEGFDDLEYKHLTYDHVGLRQLRVTGVRDVTSAIRNPVVVVDEELAMIRRMANEKVAKAKRVLASNPHHRRLNRRRVVPPPGPGPGPGPAGPGPDPISDLDHENQVSDEADLFDSGESDAPPEPPHYPPATVFNEGGPHKKISYWHPVYENVCWGTQSTLHAGTRKESISVVCHLHGCRVPNRQVKDFCGEAAVAAWLRDGVKLPMGDASKAAHSHAYRMLPRQPPG